MLLIGSIFKGAFSLYTIFPSCTNLGRPCTNGSFLPKHGYSSLGLLVSLEFYEVLLSILVQIQHLPHMREGTGHIPATRQASLALPFSAPNDGLHLLSLMLFVRGRPWEWTQQLPAWRLSSSLSLRRWTERIGQGLRESGCQGLSSDLYFG